MGSKKRYRGAVIQAFENLGATPGRLERLLNQLTSANRIDWPRATGKWTPRQILAHLSDVEVLQRVRVMAMLSQDSPVMIALNADAWASAGDYERCDARVSVATFCGLRASNLERWAKLTSAQLERRGTHPTRGEFSIAEWLNFVAKHDLNHLEQLEASLS